MFLKGLKDKLKQKSGVKFLRNELQKDVAEGGYRKGIQTMGVIVDLDNFPDHEQFYQFIELFGLRPNAVKIMGYRNFYDKNSPYATPVFSDKDLGWKGDIENSYALEFLSKEYDVLVNYYTEDKLILKLMTVKTRARVKVGFAEIDKALNDLILNTPIRNFDTFKKELKKYLTVMNAL